MEHLNILLFIVAFLGILSLICTLFIDLLKLTPFWSWSKIWLMLLMFGKDLKIKSLGAFLFQQDPSIASDENVDKDKELWKKYRPHYWDLRFMAMEAALDPQQKKYFGDWYLFVAKGIAFVIAFVFCSTYNWNIVEYINLNASIKAGKFFTGACSYHPGIFITAFLAAFGAPYWHDLFGQLANRKAAMSQAMEAMKNPKK